MTARTKETRAASSARSGMAPLRIDSIESAARPPALAPRVWAATQNEHWFSTLDVRSNRWRCDSVRLVRLKIAETWSSASSAAGASARYAYTFGRKPKRVAMVVRSALDSGGAVSSVCRGNELIEPLLVRAQACASATFAGHDRGVGAPTMRQRDSP